MRLLAQIISGVALAAMLVVPVAYLVGEMRLVNLKIILLYATVAWFIATPLWMGRESDSAPAG